MGPEMAMLIPMIMQMAQGGMQGMMGSPEKQGSTYGKGALSTLDKIQQYAQGGFGNSNIQQNQGYQQGQDWLSNLMGNDQGFWDKFEAPMQRQFEENTIPDLANRFASMGSGGSTGSTAFRNQLGREGSNLHTNIAAMRGGMQQQGANQALQYAQQPISNWQQLLGHALTPTENTYQGASTGLLGGVLPGLMSGLSQGYGQNMGQNMAGRGNQQQFPGQSPLSY